MIVDIKVLHDYIYIYVYILNHLWWGDHFSPKSRYCNSQQFHHTHSWSNKPMLCVNLIVVSPFLAMTPTGAGSILKICIRVSKFPGRAFISWVHVLYDTTGEESSTKVRLWALDWVWEWQVKSSCYWNIEDPNTCLIEMACWTWWSNRETLIFCVILWNIFWVFCLYSLYVASPEDRWMGPWLTV